MCKTPSSPQYTSPTPISVTLPQKKDLKKRENHKQSGHIYNCSYMKRELFEVLRNRFLQGFLGGFWLAFNKTTSIWRRRLAVSSLWLSFFTGLYLIDFCECWEIIFLNWQSSYGTFHWKIQTGSKNDCHSPQHKGRDFTTLFKIQISVITRWR